MVKIIPAARDSPALAMVCTMLASRIAERFRAFKMPMAITAAGIDAETVIPAYKPKYTLAAVITIPTKTPMVIAVKVNSNTFALFCVFDFFIRGLKQQKALIVTLTGDYSNLFSHLLTAPINCGWTFLSLGLAMIFLV